MIELNNEPKRLVSTFLTYRNDIDIYTEDELKDKEFYKVLFKRLLDPKINVNDITPLGCKKNVIESCKKEPDNGRKKIFIIDGDVSIIHGGNILQLEHLHVLDAYCIENFVFDENAIVNFIYLLCAQQSMDDIEKNLELDSWLATYANKLIELFIHFAIVDFFGGKFKLNNIAKYFDKESFSEKLVDIEIEQIKKDILNITSQENYEAKLFELKERWPVSNENLIRIVSGKDFLLPILLNKTKKFRKSKALPTNDEAKFILAQFCSLDKFNRLKEEIESLCFNQPSR